MNGMQMKYHRDHASKEEVFKFTQQKARELYRKLFTVYEKALTERYTPINGRYMSHNSSQYLELEKVIDSYQDKMNYLNNKYLAQDVQN